MQWLTLCVLTSAVYGGGGVTKTSGLEQFWTDDYKVFEQIYGKTSDKEIYGATLPAAVKYGPLNSEATEKKERYLFQYDKHLSNSYDLGDHYNKLLSKSKAKSKPATSFNFISYADPKPISLNNDPETYNYLKHLEHMDKQNGDFYPTAGGFKPYLNNAGGNMKDMEEFKSIQDILHAHETNKGSKRPAGDTSKYMSYGKDKRTKPARSQSNDTSKSRCAGGRCRKRSSTSGSRPHVRRIKQRIVKY